MSEVMPAATGVTVNTAPPSGMTAGEAGNISYHLGSLSSAVDSVKVAVADVRNAQVQSFALIKETRDNITEMLVNHEGLRQRVTSVEGDVGEMKTSVEGLKQDKWKTRGMAAAIGSIITLLTLLAAWFKTKVIP